MTLMFEQSRQKKGHIDMVLKRYDGHTKHTPKPENTHKPEYLRKMGKKKPKPSEQQLEPTEKVDPDVRKLLLRVTFKTEKISTVVEPEEVPKFSEAYLKLLRNNMNELKREKKKKKPANAAKTN